MSRPAVSTTCDRSVTSADNRLPSPNHVSRCVRIKVRMWIVRIALNRPYTFVVLALLILGIGPLTIARTPTDIFPNIDIPVVSVIWNYGGLSAQDMADRIISNFERSLTTAVNDIEHIESQSLRGSSVVKVFLQPGAKIDLAGAQATAVSQAMLRQAPVGTTPPFIITYNASSVPIIQLALSGRGLSEQQLFDLGVNFIRPQLATVSGAAIPWPYGGKQPQVQVDLDPAALQAKNLAPADVVNAITQQNLILPSGTSKIGSIEYDVDLNASPQTINELNDLPIKTVGTTPIYIRDVAHVRNGYPPQTNIARVDGQRAALMVIQKTGNASTLDVIANIKDAVAKVLPGLTPNLEVKPLADQSLFVRASIQGVLREAVIAACLTAFMILVFLGSWRSTLIIAVSIPLSILSSIIVLSALGETINIMTLGGLALAVGILVDDATVAIENINWHLEQGKDLEPAILDGSQQIAIPAFVSTICICIVFVPMFFLTGVGRYLFVPMAEAVVFAMLASYVLSRTLVPTMAKYLLHAHEDVHGATRSRNPLVRLQHAIDHGFMHLRDGYRGLLQQAVDGRRAFVLVFLAGCLASLVLARWVGEDFFPGVDSGQFKLHLRAPTGTRIEETAALCDRVQQAIREVVPEREIVRVIDNIGLPYSGINLAYTNSAPIGSSDADVLVSLSADHHPTDQYIHDLRRKLAQEFPGVLVSFIPADIVTQILNFAQPRRQPPVRGGAPAETRAGPGDGGPARASGVQPAAAAPRRRSDACRADRVHAARRGEQPAHLAVRQRPGDADLLAEPGDRRQLHDRHADAAVQGRLAAGHRDHPGGRRGADDAAGAGGARVGQARGAPGGGVALQRAAGDRHLRRRAGARSRRRRARDAADPRRRGEGPAARIADRRPRHGRDDDLVVRRPGRRPRPGDRPRLSADRRELPVVAGSVHHHLGAAGGARRDRVDAVPVAHDDQRALADRRDHVHGRRHREQHPGGVVRKGAVRRRRVGGGGGGGRRLHAVPSGADDGAGHDHRD